MKNLSEDHIALAAEYALGTLDVDERALVETMAFADNDFSDEVNVWVRKLSALSQMVSPVDPPSHVWDNIIAEVSLVDKPFRDLLDVPNVHSIGADAPKLVVEPVVGPEPGQTNVVQLSHRKVTRGPLFGWVMTALAASLAGVIALQAHHPEFLPENLRVRPKVQLVEVRSPAPPLAAQFVAVLQENATTPAFILTVDTATKNFTVRKVGATQAPGKSYELWIVSDKLQRPRSLGVIGDGNFTTRPVLSSYDADTIDKATYAVTLEPEGGSPTGVATGPIVFTGKLVESVPSKAGPTR